MVSGEMVKSMVRVDIHLQIAISMMDSLLMVIDLGKESILGQMEVIMKENGEEIK